MNKSMDWASCFQAYRSALLQVAYRMLGSVMDAEDVLQDAYLKCHQHDLHEIQHPYAWLTTVVTRLSIDRLRKRQSQQRIYSGVWLPEPLIQLDQMSSEGQSTDEKIIEQESISIALMVMLERLNPEQRAVFVLRDVLDQSFELIAETLNKTQAACRKILSRARMCLSHDDGWSLSDRGCEITSSKQVAEVHFVQQFRQAIDCGDVWQVMAILDERVLMAADGGGKATAIPRPLLGMEAVGRFLGGLAKQGFAIGEQEKPKAQIRLIHANGGVGAALYLNGHLESWFQFVLNQQGLAEAIYAIRNPDKLASVAKQIKLISMESN